MVREITTQTGRRERMHTRRKLKRKRGLFITACLILIVLAVILLSGAKHPEAVGYEYVTGTSLWGMAEEYCPDGMDKRDYISEVMALNAMADSVVYANRLYAVPIYEK